MDIAAMSIAMHQISLENTVQLSVMKMAMNSTEGNSNEAINMIENMAVEPNKGENIDVVV